MSRPFDIVLFGATGFTGALVAQYLKLHAPPGTRLALAGRSQQKLDALKSSLGVDWPVLLADSSDAAALTALAKQTRVVCTTVGPYAKHGLPLVEACAREGTHYCDLTGEVQFMREAIDRFDAVAKSSGARIVHTCGFDSIPSDLGVQALFEALGPLKRATYTIVSLRGGASGGTVASLMNLLEQGSGDRALRRLLKDPWALSPKRDEEADLGPQPDIFALRYDDFTGQWVTPFFMAQVNTRVVRRSNALLGHAWGARLRYEEVFGMKRGAGAVVRGALTAGALGTFFSAMVFSPTRAVLKRVLPKPGEGPDEKARDAGRMRVRIFGENERGERKSVLVEGEGDPGYKLTAVMLGQSALCLAFDEAALPKTAGVLTPATAMGAVLRARLVAAGMRFTVEEAQPKKPA